jgi:hypothetical protein
LKETFGGKDYCPLLVIANEANPAGVVGEILGASDLLLVSGESVSMVSEAVSSGKPVIVFLPCAWSGLKSKHRRFLDGLLEKKCIFTGGPEEIYGLMKQGLAHSNGMGSAFLAQDREALQAALSRVI